MPATNTLSAKEVAAELGTDGRTLRKFLRSSASPITPVGQGNRYAIKRGEVKAIRKGFTAWLEAKAAKAAAAAEEASNEAAADEVEELEVIEDLDADEVEA